MVESLKELNSICQKSRYKQVGNWMVRHILRDAALPITWLLLHTPVTANQVTLFSLLLGLAGTVLFAFPSNHFFLTGCVFLQLWYLLDHVDGQIARYRKSASLTGRFFDFLMHHLIHAPVFFSLGFYAFRVTGFIFLIVWGFITSLSVILLNMMNDIRCKAFFEALTEKEAFYVIKSPEATSKTTQNRTKSFGQQVISHLHKLVEIHVLMNILTGLAVLNTWLGLGNPDLRFYAFLFYGSATPFLTITKISYWIQRKKIDADFEHTFKGGA